MPGTQVLKVCIISSDDKGLNSFYENFIQHSGTNIAKQSLTITLESKKIKRFEFAVWKHDASYSPLNEINRATEYPGTHVFILLDRSGLRDLNSVHNQLKILRKTISNAFIIFATQPRGLDQLQDGPLLAHKHNCVIYFEYDRTSQRYTELFDAIDDIMYQRLFKKNSSYPNQVITSLLPARAALYSSRVLNIDTNNLTTGIVELNHEDILRNIHQHTWSDLDYLGPENIYEAFLQSKLPIDETKDKTLCRLVDYFICQRNIECAANLIRQGAFFNHRLVHDDDMAALQKAQLEYRQHSIPSRAETHERNTRHSTTTEGDLQARLIAIAQLNVFIVNTQKIRDIISCVLTHSLSRDVLQQLVALLDQIKHPSMIIKQETMREALLACHHSLTSKHALFDPIYKLMTHIDELVKQINDKHPDIKN